MPTLPSRKVLHNVQARRGQPELKKRNFCNMQTQEEGTLRKYLVFFFILVQKKEENPS